jgi:hypothetical protein
MIITATGVNAADLDIDGRDIAIEDVYVQAKLSDSGSESVITLYIWVVLNDQARLYTNLEADILIDDTRIANNLTINSYAVEKQTSSTDLSINKLEQAFVYEDYKQFINGSHTVKVKFVNYENDAIATNNERSVTFTSPTEWYGVITNGLWSLLYSIEGVFKSVSDGPGLGFLADIPVLPLLIGIVFLAIIIFLYLRMRKKRGFRQRKNSIQARPNFYRQQAYQPPSAYDPPEYPPTQY